MPLYIQKSFFTFLQIIQREIHQEIKCDYPHILDGNIYIIFHQLNCKGSHLIYLLQCRICQLQYIGKGETSFNIRLYNHRKDSKNKNPILPWKPFQNSNQNFQRDAKFALIEQITKTFTTIEQLRILLKKRENFWILKVKTLNPDGFNQELKNIQKLLHCHLQFKVWYTYLSHWQQEHNRNHNRTA